MVFKKEHEHGSHRDYRSEYDNYQGQPAQIKRRDSRNKARAEMVRAGKAHKGDGKDVDHKKGVGAGKCLIINPELSTIIEVINAINMLIKLTLEVSN